MMEICAESLKLALGGADILKEVTVKASKGEFIGVIGPNGSGKSTLLKCIYRVLHPDGGEIELNGRPLRTYSYKESAREMAVVAQHNYYNFEFSVRDVVLMGRSPHKKAMERDNQEDYRIVEEALKTVGMEEFKDRSFSTLSGGEQQRVILARALAQKTNCLILDEPTNHLDIKYQLQLMDIVHSLGLTVISAIHDLNIAAMYCDKIFVVKDGEIAAFGKPEEVLTKDFIKKVYEVDVELLKDKNGVLHILYSPGSISVEGRHEKER